jgi:hypothetical protein
MPASQITLEVVWKIACQSDCAKILQLLRLMLVLFLRLRLRYIADHL